MDRSDYSLVRSRIAASSFPRIVVAIPVQNEAERISTCLNAIAAQCRLGGGPLDEQVGILCFVNNSTDPSFDIAVGARHGSRVSARVYDAKMSPSSSHAGGARRVALDLAARWMREGRHDDGLLLTTDADSTPAPDWIAAAQAAIERGADCVAGPIDLYAEDEAVLPAHVQERGQLEAQYEALLTELFARLDPRSHDPWPTHAAEAGANLAITLRAFESIGGCPNRACGEDRALVARVDRLGLRVRHEPTMRVATSGRLVGRAEGGVADTIRLRCDEPEALCDGYLEPALNARFRASWRGRLRAIFATEGPVAAQRAFGFSEDITVEDQSFGAFWDALEAADARLARVLLRPSDLPREIAAATVMCWALRPLERRTGCRDRDDNPMSVPAE